MKSLFCALGFLILPSSYADSTPYVMDQRGVAVVNDLLSAIRETKEAKAFAQITDFQSITATYSADRLDTAISAFGEINDSEDKSCGLLKLKVVRNRKITPTKKMNEARTTYCAELDTTEIEKRCSFVPSSKNRCN